MEEKPWQQKQKFNHLLDSFISALKLNVIVP